MMLTGHFRCSFTLEIKKEDNYRNAVHLLKCLQHGKTLFRFQLCIVLS